MHNAAWQAHHLRPPAVAWYKRIVNLQRQYNRPQMMTLATACDMFVMSG